jgi:hypothetical protein
VNKNRKIYILADGLLEEMLENPVKGYSGDDIIQICSCTEKEETNIAAVLLNGKYVQYPSDEKGKPCGNQIYLTNEGGNFILSGGFKGVIKKEKLMIRHIKASIISVIVSTLVAVLTLAVLLFK